MNEKKQVPIVNKTTGDVTVGHQRLKARSAAAIASEPGATTAENTEPTEGAIGVAPPNPIVSRSSHDDQKAKKLRPRIDSIAGVIEFGYSRKGQHINIKRGVLKQLAGTLALTEDDRGKLTELSEHDRLLAVPRQLLLLSRDLLELPRIRNEVREFVRHVLRLHPMFVANELDSVIQNLEGAPSIRDAFVRIADTDLSKLNAVAGERIFKSADLEDLKRNAIGCLGVWAAEMRGLSVADLTSALFDGYWDNRSRAVQAEADVLRAITDIREPVGAGLICGDFKKRAEEHARSAEAAKRAATAAAADLQRVIADLEAAKARVSHLEAHIGNLMQAAEGERNASRITQTLLRDGLESQRTRVLRRLNDDVRLLGDGLVALSRVPPKVEIMIDHAERVMDSLKNEIKKLSSGE